MLFRSVVTVVALHPVVVHFEGVLPGLLSVNDYAPVLCHTEAVPFVNAYRTLIDGQVLQCQSDALSLLRYPYGTVIVACPAITRVQRVYVPNNPQDFCQLDEYYQKYGKSAGEYFYWLAANAWLWKMNSASSNDLKKIGYDIRSEGHTSELQSRI